MFEIRDDLRPEDIPRRRGRGPKPKYRLGELLPGQHLVVPRPEGVEKERARTPIQSAVSRFRAQHPEAHFSIRYDREHDVFRVFRLDDAPAKRRRTRKPN